MISYSFLNDYIISIKIHSFEDIENEELELFFNGEEGRMAKFLSYIDNVEVNNKTKEEKINYINNIFNNIFSIVGDSYSELEKNIIMYNSLIKFKNFAENLSFIKNLDETINFEDFDDEFKYIYLSCKFQLLNIYNINEYEDSLYYDYMKNMVYSLKDYQALYNQLQTNFNI